MGKIEIPPDTNAPLPASVIAATMENGEVADTAANSSEAAASTSAGSATTTPTKGAAGDAGKQESPPKSEEKKKPQPRLKANTPRRPKPNK